MEVEHVLNIPKKIFPTEFDITIRYLTADEFVEFGVNGKKGQYAIISDAVSHKVARLVKLDIVERDIDTPSKKLAVTEEVRMYLNQQSH